MVMEWGIKALILDNDHFLAVHKATVSEKQFELPGGRMIFGETIEETLIREVKEEINLDVRPTKLLDTWHMTNEEQGWQVSGVIYVAERLDHEQEIKLSKEHDHYEWLSRDNLEKMTDVFYPKMKEWNWNTLLGSNRVH